MRSSTALSVLLALACGCDAGHPAPAELQKGAKSALAAPRPCEVDPTAIPPLPDFAEPEEGRARLRLEAVESPALGRCVPVDELVSGPALEGPVLGAISGDGAARRFALHRVRDVARLGDGPFLLAAGDAGLFLHDTLTLARRARLHDAPASAVAASPDGTTAAALLARPRMEGSDAEQHTLLVFDGWTLEVFAEIDGAPKGRLRFSPDGKRLVLASTERVLWVYDLERRNLVRRAMEDELSDAAFVPDRPNVVALVGDANEVRFHDLATGGAIAQSAGAALRTGRDLNAVALVASSGLTVAGGDDDRLHVYRGMLGERAAEVGAIALDGEIEDIACCREGRFAVGTSRGRIEWLEGLDRLRAMGPLVPGLLGDPIRLVLVEDEVVAAFLGQLFRWPGGASVVGAPYASGELVLTDASEEDLVVVLRVGSSFAIHRVEGPSRPEATTEELGRLPWADVRRVLRAEDGIRVILGSDSTGVKVAYLDRRGELTTTVGAGMALRPRFEAARIVPGLFVLWDEQGTVYELDVASKTSRLVGRVESPGPGMRISRHVRRGYEAHFEGSRRRLAVASVEPEPR